MAKFGKHPDGYLAGMSLSWMVLWGEMTTSGNMELAVDGVSSNNLFSSGRLYMKIIRTVFLGKGM